MKKIKYYILKLFLKYKNILKTFQILKHTFILKNIKEVFI